VPEKKIVGISNFIGEKFNEQPERRRNLAAKQAKYSCMSNTYSYDYFRDDELRTVSYYMHQ
jgi:hypothetical protein